MQIIMEHEKKNGQEFYCFWKKGEGRRLTVSSAYAGQWEVLLWHSKAAYKLAVLCTFHTAGEAIELALTKLMEPQ